MIEHVHPAGGEAAWPNPVVLRFVAASCFGGSRSEGRSALNKRSLLLSVTVLAATMLCCSGALPAQGNLPDIDLAYNGGPLIQNVHVYTVFWGPQWKQSQSRQDLFNGFFKALFDDGRYMANLTQYNTNGYKIHNGKFVGTMVDD